MGKYQRTWKWDRVVLHCPVLAAITGETAVLACGPRDVKILRNKLSRTDSLNNLISGARYAVYLLIAWRTVRVGCCWGNTWLSGGGCLIWGGGSTGHCKELSCKISEGPSTRVFLFRMHLSSAECKTEVCWYSGDPAFQWRAAIPWYALQQLAISFMPVHINQINKASRGKTFLCPLWWYFDIQFPTVSTYDSYLLEAC